MPLSLIFNVTNKSFNAIRENKILSKISEFTVQFAHGLAHICRGYVGT